MQNMRRFFVSPTTYQRRKLAAIGFEVLSFGCLESIALGFLLSLRDGIYLALVEQVLLST